MAQQLKEEENNDDPPPEENNDDPPPEENDDPEKPDEAKGGSPIGWIIGAVALVGIIGGGIYWKKSQADKEGGENKKVYHQMVEESLV